MYETHQILFYGEFVLSPIQILSRIHDNPGNDNRSEKYLVSKWGRYHHDAFVAHAEKCYNEQNGACAGETGTLYPEPFTIVPFRLVPDDQCVLAQMQDVLLANERFIQSNEIEFPLMPLKSAADRSYDDMGTDRKSATFEQEIAFKSNWCCHGHYYLTMLVKALYSMGYSCDEAPLRDKVAFLPNKAVFRKSDGTSVLIKAEAGL